MKIVKSYDQSIDVWSTYSQMVLKTNFGSVLLDLFEKFAGRSKYITLPLHNGITSKKTFKIYIVSGSKVNVSEGYLKWSKQSTTIYKP